MDETTSFFVGMIAGSFLVMVGYVVGHIAGYTAGYMSRLHGYEKCGDWHVVTEKKNKDAENVQSH